jgi:hypothetical protein
MQSLMVSDLFDGEKPRMIEGRNRKDAGVDGLEIQPIAGMTHENRCARATVTLITAFFAADEAALLA